jgi:hypothetical protein
VRVTALAWTGSHFEPTRTWALDRRRRGTEPAPGATARTAPA